MQTKNTHSLPIVVFSKVDTKSIEADTPYILKRKYSETVNLESKDLAELVPYNNGDFNMERYIVVTTDWWHTEASLRNASIVGNVEVEVITSYKTTLLDEPTPYKKGK